MLLRFVQLTHSKNWNGAFRFFSQQQTNDVTLPIKYERSSIIPIVIIIIIIIITIEMIKRFIVLQITLASE